MSGWKGIERHAHWLSRNVSSKRPEAILFLDTEAKVEHVNEVHDVQTFRLGVVCYCEYVEGEGLVVREWRNLVSPADLWEWIGDLSTQHKQLLVIAHNLDYDGRIARMFSSLPQCGWEPTYFIPAQTCTLYVWERGKCKLTLADNMNWFNTTIAELGEVVGLQKLEVDFETASDEELFVYCRRDVGILVEWWKLYFKFLDERDLGNFGITAAKQAFNAYRHRFMPCHIGVHNHAEAMELERSAYSGGRVGCFVEGKLPPGTYYKLDVNSLYPAMMRAHDMPCKLIGVQEGVSVWGLESLIYSNYVIAEVLLDAQEPAYPTKLAGRNAFPTGQFFTTLTTPELRLALSTGRVHGIGKVAIYESADLFSEYVDYFYDLRLQFRDAGNEVGARLCKMFLNSLPGKFGQRGYKQEVVADAPIDDVWVRHCWDVDMDEPYMVYCFGGKVIMQRKKGEPYDNLPAIPAHVNAYARLYMWELMKQAGVEHVFYIDTDCLFVDEVGYQALADRIDGSKLGYLKLEGIAEDVELFAKKDYRFGDKRVVKGIKANAVEAKPGVYEQRHWTTVNYGFRTNQLGQVDTFKVKKQMRYSTLSGTVGPDGRISPPCLHVTAGQVVERVNLAKLAHRQTWEFDDDWLVELCSKEEREGLGDLGQEQPKSPGSTRSDPPVVSPPPLDL